uniref:Uncharacterized protein n=2 Tax=Oryza meridionalis TaxID=40149 RepID=A0A0E0EMJ7_9ORYZ
MTASTNHHRRRIHTCSIVRHHVLQFGASEQFGTWRGGGAAAAAATAEGEGRWRSGRRRSKFWANGRRRLVVVGMSEK